MKKIGIIIGVIIIVIIGVVCYLLFGRTNYSKIYLEINPSIEIDLDKKGQVVNVIAYNEDAKAVVENINTKSLDEVFNIIAEECVKRDYINKEDAVILLYSEGIDKNELDRKIRDSFGKVEIDPFIMTIDDISKEDEKLAKEYGISPLKAAYINLIKEEHENVSVENIVDYSMKELDDTRNNGTYCDKGYILEGEQCLKEISRHEASLGEICKRDYNEYKGKCYRNAGVIETDKFYCSGEFTLEGEECTRTLTHDAVGENPTCSSGTLGQMSDIGLSVKGSGYDPYICYDLSNAKEPTLRCLLNKGHKMVNGKCYNGPAPLINGGCPGNDKVIGGWCYSPDDGDQWQCPDGRIYQHSKGGVPKYCPDTIKYNMAVFSSYKCDEDWTVEGTKCIKIERQPADRERVCPEGYTKVEGDRCFNMKDETPKEKGYRCEEENSRLAGNECIIYEIVEAHR